MTNLAYKLLDHGKSYGDTVWPRPAGKRPGKWMPPIEGKLVPCENAYHVLETPADVLAWLDRGNELLIVEWRGESERHGDKRAVTQARLVRRVKAWDAKAQRLFAADCAEHVLPIFEAAYPDDDRPRKAIDAARAFVDGEIGRDEMLAAAARLRG